MVAGRGVGIWDIDTVEIPIKTVLYKPQITDDEREMRYSKWKMAVERSLAWDV